MSLLAIAWKQYPDYPLIIAANRNEFYDRPAAPLQRWDGNPAFYAGKDMREGGTWLAIGESGRFAAVTDFHWHQDPAPAPGLSRGQLVLEYMRSTQDPEAFLRDTAKRRAECLPHNLVVGDSESLYYACSVSHVIEELSPGLHAVGDYFVDARMPKCRYLLDQIAEKLEDRRLTETERRTLLEALRRPMRFPEAELPSRGYPADIERDLSPVFLDLDGFGTVSSSLISVDRYGQVVFYEQGWRHDKPGNPVPDGPVRSQSFSLLTAALR